MDYRRFLLALALSLAVIFVVQMLFPAAKTPIRLKQEDNSALVAKREGVVSGTTAVAVPSQVVPFQPQLKHEAGVPSVSAETAVFQGHSDRGARFGVSNVGAALVSVVMNAYENRSPVGGPVNLAVLGQPVVKYRVIAGQSAPIDLSSVPFSVSRQADSVTYHTVLANAVVSIRYAFLPDSYTVHVRGTVANTTADTVAAMGNVARASPSYILVDLPTTFSTTESDTTDDRNYLAYTYMSKREGARNVLFRSLDPGEKTLVTGPLTWVAAKSKYFVVGMLAPRGMSFDEVTLVGGARTSKVATHASATVVVPVNNGMFAFDLYMGPQSLRQLEAQGRDFDQVNPYGWAFLRGVMQPIATGVTRLVLWMHERLALSYGLVLVLLGVFVRLILWPLNQSAMRSSLKMQELQPKLQAVQTKYKDDVERQRVEVMKVYSEHGMNPLSPLMGCLPMLLPMPVLLALFFVFRNTIEFRGVSFLWLTDLSSRDPYYILPLLMGVSMYVLSWIGMRNAPSNPQAKMMSYMMPIMFVAFLARAASGLNLYYAVQNLAALPQQWMLSTERTRQGAKSQIRQAK